ncbi:hypothetical protein FOWG_17095 [Fusarium oxysporum f. sp. lycopersici MN25]|nr:hypothetical protein FOWG_17095 [Fusarium oxysporum f. sp. lycopersici MN25]
MASTDASQEVAERSISEKGFYCWQDTLAGDRVSDFDRKGCPYFTVYGLDFLIDFAFNPHIQHILNAFLDRCVLGHYLKYKALPEPYIECFRRGGPDAGRRVFVVHVCSKQSQIIYYAGSHLHRFETTVGARSNYEVSQEQLSHAGCEPRVMGFPDGALVVFDARVCFEMKQGYTIAFMFATEDVLADWAKIYLPNSTILQDKVAQIEDINPKIGHNFVFQKN